MARARYKSLVDSFAADIRAGRLTPGTRLPTHRRLAAQERMSLVTASRVYAELEAMGLVSGETGRGTFVREISLPPGLGIDQHAVATDMLDLNFNYPTLSSQSELLRTALRQLAASGDLDALLRYQPHAGRPHERAIVARHLSRRGLTLAAENVLLVNGAQQGLAITVMGLLQPGDVVAVDALTYPGFKILAESYHLELVAIPALSDGPDLAALERLCRQRPVRAVYCMPTLHNPLGWVLSEPQRHRLVALAREHGLLIIEDAAYAYLADQPPLPLATLAPECTVYISGFSKNVATGLRVGVVAAPEKWLPALERAIRATTWNTLAIMTAILCEWIEDGTVARLEVEKRQDARLRQSIAREALAGLDLVGYPDSYFLWLPLPEEVRADRIDAALLTERISLSTAEPFATSAHVPHALRLALGSLPLPTLRQALDAVKRVIQLHTHL
ncbi:MULTISPECIES: PLP-dependent aminotransferase family protein [unclassified Serratia (in: enterobacteria)]|uniref:aminotransferase-like domain-containing protein n=1 Tax=unclassified Serratia (in: enterobacteria) TaxID=2647522 RepID=UPI00046A9672|nr:MULTISPECIES: PLP-dependent aminotransferase family protein [unclassified Serratia (in: enterobacteria)]